MKVQEKAPTETPLSPNEVTDRFNDQMTQDFGDTPGLFEAQSIPEIDQITSKYINAIKQYGAESTPVVSESTPTFSDTIEDQAAAEQEALEHKKFSLRRTLGRLSLSRLGAEMSITQMNMAERKQQLLEKAENPNEKLTRMERIRLAIGRRGLAVAAGVVSTGGIFLNALALSKGLDLGTSHGSTRIEYETAAVVKPLDPNAPSNPIFVPGHTQGRSNVMPDAARQAGVAGFNGGPRVARYDAEIGGIIPGERQTWDQSGEQAKQAILAQARPGDTVVSHSQGGTGALKAAAERPDLNVRAIATPYAPNNGLFAPHSVANSSTVSPILKAFGVSTENPGPKNGSKITYDVNDGGMAHGGRGTGDVWTATVDKDGTINPFRALSNGLGTAYLGTHELDAHSGTPYAITKNADGSTTRHFNSGTRVINPMTGKAYESGITATLQKNNGIATPANIDHAAKLLEGDSNGNINAREVGDTVAPGLGNVTAAFQPLADAIKPVQKAIANPTPESINTAISTVTQGLGGAAPVAKPQGGGNGVANTINQWIAPSNGKPAASVNATVNAPAPVVPTIPKLPTPQQFQADPIGTGMGLLGTFLGGKK